MNKKVVAIIIVVLILLGIGIWFKSSKKGATTAMNTTQTTTTVPTSANMFTSIQDALSKSLTLQCSFSDEEGRNTQSYIKGGAIRSDFTGKTPDQAGSMIFKSGKMYFWNNTKKTGMMMQFDMNDMMNRAKAMMPTGSPAAKPDQSAQGQNFVQALEKYRKSCKPGVVADNLFTPPTDVKFTDYTEMMNNVKKMMPSGTPGAVNQEQIKQMMQKYAPNQ